MHLMLITMRVDVPVASIRIWFYMLKLVPPIYAHAIKQSCYEFICLLVIVWFTPWTDHEDEYQNHLKWEDHFTLISGDREE